jgi:hypothetical protein
MLPFTTKDDSNIKDNNNICQMCHKGELIFLEDEEMLVCNICLTAIPYLIVHKNENKNENEKISYKEVSYRRLDHFKEILTRNNETTQMPPDIIENIKLKIKQEGSVSSELSNVKIKEFLKNVL